jgi:hypothetical protein
MARGHPVSGVRCAWAPPLEAPPVTYVWKNAGSGYAYVDDVALAPTDGAAAPAPAPAPAPSPAADVGVILLKIGRDSDAYWVDDGVWGQSRTWACASWIPRAPTPWANGTNTW